MDHFDDTGFQTKPQADLALKNARVVNVLSGDIHETDVAILNGVILGFGEYDAKARIDLGGSYICPGFVDGPIHVERSLLLPQRFACDVVPYGVTTVIENPEDICRILGWDGLRFMMDASLRLPVSVFFTNSQYVNKDLPGSGMENMILKELFDLIAETREPFVLGREPASQAGYLHADDMKPVFPKEIPELLREGGNIRLIGDSTFRETLQSTLPFIDQYNSSRFMFVSGSSFPGETASQLRIDNMVQMAIESGLHAVMAVQMATINTARYYRIGKRGAIAPGFTADILVLSDLENYVIDQVYKNGILVAEDYDLVGWEFPKFQPPLRDTMNINWELMEGMDIQAQGSSIRVIGVLPDRSITEEVILDAPIEHNRVVSDPKQDILKAVVLDRHYASGDMGKGFVTGFELREGAIASSVTFPGHQVISVGVRDEDIITAIEEIEKMRGGIAVVKKGVVLESLALPLAGIMCDESPENVARKMEDIACALRECGSNLPNPVMTLSTLTCLDIPSLRITEKGLYDFQESRFVELFTE
jgi:adenine deaminase